MALKPKKGQEISPAALQSPSMKQASTICTLYFYYNTYGEGISAMCKGSKHRFSTNMLSWLKRGHFVQMKLSWMLFWGRVPRQPRCGGNLSATKMFGNPASSRWVGCLRTSPSHLKAPGPSTSPATSPLTTSVSATVVSLVVLFSLDFAFRIFFEAKVHQGFVFFTEPQPVCPDTMFKCNNSVCVESKNLCDYGDDCGDRSDENDCGEISQRPWQQPDRNLKYSPHGRCSILEQSKRKQES